MALLIRASYGVVVRVGISGKFRVEVRARVRVMIMVRVGVEVGLS